MDKESYPSDKAAIVGDDLVTPGNSGKIRLGNPCQESSECRSACCAPLVLDDIDEVGPLTCQAYENIDDGQQCHRHCQCKNKRCNPLGPSSKERVCGKMSDKGVFPTGGTDLHVINGIMKIRLHLPVDRRSRNQRNQRNQRMRPEKPERMNQRNQRNQRPEKPENRNSDEIGMTKKITTMILWHTIWMMLWVPV